MKLIPLILLLFAVQIDATTYYLDKNVVGGNDDGTSPANAWDTLSDAQTFMNSEPNNGSGHTVIVYNGEYGAYVEVGKIRTDWLVYETNSGHNPEFSRVQLNTQGDVLDVYLRFDGLTIRSVSPWPNCLEARSSRYTQWLNLNVIGYGPKENFRGFLGHEGSSDILIDNCTFSAGEVEGRLSGFVDAIELGSNVSNVTITNNEMKQFSAYGVFVSNNNVIIRDNEIHEYGGDGIAFGTGDGPMLIENNIVYDLSPYVVTLTETPTETIWSADGLTMSNNDANWGVNEPIVWETTIEIVIASGTNVYIGDKDIRVDDVVGPTEVLWDGSVALRELAFTDAGPYVMKFNETIAGEISLASAQIVEITIDTGSFAGADADGTLTLRPLQAGTFEAETLRVGANLDICTIAGDSSVLQVSNVDYFLRDKIHGDPIQCFSSENVANVTIRNNQFYDAFSQLGWFDPNPSVADYGGTNWLVENNLFWDSYGSALGEQGARVGLFWIDGLVCRNNIVSGTLTLEECNDVDFHSNIASNIFLADTVLNLSNNYNIYNRGGIDSHELGPNSVFFNIGVSNEDWNDPDFRAIFTDFDANDFTHASADSLGVGFGDPENSAPNDIDGNVRGGDPDAGAYEFQGGDETAPTPDPATWSVEPIAVDSNSITMTATTAIDADGSTPVEYFFDETSNNFGGTDSGWQQSSSYTDSGLSPSTQYTYRVRTRDSLGNTTGWSGEFNATTDFAATPPDTDPPEPNPAQFSTKPTASETTDTITMTAVMAVDENTPVEYQFDETTGNGNDSEWQSSRTYTDTGLSANTLHTYRVRSRDGLGNIGSYSIGESTTTEAAPVIVDWRRIIFRGRFHESGLRGRNR